jgi:hypothetical protein
MGFFHDWNERGRLQSLGVQNAKQNKKYASASKAKQPDQGSADKIVLHLFTEIRRARCMEKNAWSKLAEYLADNRHHPNIRE